MCYLHYLDKCESLTCTPSFHSFSLSLSLRDSGSKPDRVRVLTEDYLLFPAIQERTQLRAGERRRVCMRARASARILRQEGEKKAMFLLARALALEEDEGEK